MVARFLAAALLPPDTAVPGRGARLLAHFVLLLHFVAAVLLGVQAVREPLGNWDIVPYVALVRSAAGVSGPALNQQTYAQLQEYLGPKYPQLLAQGGGPDDAYRTAVHDSPAALVENLKFYAVKPLYIQLVRAAAAVTGNAAQAAVLVSAAAFSLFVMIFPLFFRWRVAAVAATWLLVTSGAPALKVIAACATPDSLGLLFAGTAALLAVARTRPALVGVLGLLAVLARPDTMFLLGPLLLGLAWLQRRDTDARHWLAILALLSVVFLYLGSQSPPWNTLFRHTFFGRIPFPEAGVAAVTPAEYWAVVTRTFPNAANARVVIVLLAGCALAIVPSLRSRSFGAAQLLAASAVINIVAHYVIFPIDEFGHERLFLSSYFLVLAALILSLERGAPARRIA
ncbi:MAG: hypothetical protein JWQ07_3120 [Ramlibacter sp.]|nr:hypothetical protein [Ramlibacter sp.]